MIDAMMEHPGLLVFSDTYHPDWQVTIDGKPGMMFRTDYLIRSVFLPAGQHTVRFVFVPKGFYVGMVISGISLLLLAVLLFKKKRPL